MPVASAEQRRERRVVWGGVVVVVCGLLLAYAVMPFGRRFVDREAAARTLANEADSLAGLVASAAMLESLASAQERVLAESGRRTLHARSATLAASALQSLLQDASDASHLVVTRLDVAPAAAAADTTMGARRTDGGETSRTALSLPATLAAHCDVVGLAALLDHLARAPRVVYVDRVTVQQNSSLRGAPDMLQVSLSLRAPVVLE